MTKKNHIQDKESLLVRPNRLNLIEDEHIAIIGGLLQDDILGRVPDAAGSVSQIYYFDDYVLRVSCNSDSNIALQLCNDNNIVRVPKSFGYFGEELEDGQLIDATKLEVLSVLDAQNTPAWLIEVSELLYGGVVDGEELEMALGILRKFDPELATAVEFICEISKVNNFDTDFNITNFMMRKQRNEIVLSDPVV